VPASDPWGRQLAELRKGPHRLVWKISAHHADLPGGKAELAPARIQLDWDEARAPRVQLRLDVASPSAELDTALDPRNGVRIHVHAGYMHKGQLLQRVLVADLGLRRRSAIDPSGVLALEASSDEALVIDGAPSSIFSTQASNSPRGHIQTLITSCIPTAQYVVTAASTTAFAYAAGQMDDKWQMIEDLADGIGDVDVYDDGLRTFYVEPRPVLQATPVLELVDGVGGTVIERSSALSREDWYNRVILVYRWQVSGVENVIQSVRSITAGPAAATAGNTRSYTEERSTPTTQARADVAAASLVKRMASRGRTLSVRAVAVPWLRPGMTVRLTLRTGQARHLVSSVVFDGQGWMEFTTRYPDSTETIGP
jgi:hypothetical protein